MRPGHCHCHCYSFTQESLRLPIQADRQAAAAQAGAAAGLVWAAHGRDNAEEVADLRERVKGVREVIVQRQRGSIDD